MTKSVLKPKLWKEDKCRLHPNGGHEQGHKQEFTKY